MKIAIISDIHGNMEALQSVLNDIECENCKALYCLGDLAMAGPEPTLAIKKIQELQKSKNFHLIQGNTDEMLANFSFDIYNKILELNTTMAAAYLADSQLLTDEEKQFLNNLAKQEIIELGELKILLVHGSPRKNNENIFPDLKIEEVEEIIKGTSANIIFCGHTHTPCGYQTNTEQTVVNVGSVGRPFTEKPEACYAILDINENDLTYTIKHKFVKYDIEKAAKKLINRGFEGCEKLAEILKNPTSRYPK